MTPARRPGVALALGGGAALGWAHLGVLAVLAETGVPVAAVAGTSIGALAAVCLAAGRLDELERIARGATRARVLRYLDPHLGRGAWLGGRRIARELGDHLAAHRLEALAMPCACVAADVATGEEVRLAAGPAIPAIQASIALPGLFRPVALGGRTLMDGGVVANLPLAAAAALAPGRPVVGVDLFADHLPAPVAPASALAVSGRGYLLLLASQTRQALALHPPALVIRPAIGRWSLGSFTAADPLITAGRRAAEAALPALREVVAGSWSGVG